MDAKLCGIETMFACIVHLSCVHVFAFELQLIRVWVLQHRGFFAGHPILHCIAHRVASFFVLHVCIFPSCPS